MSKWRNKDVTVSLIVNGRKHFSCCKWTAKKFGNSVHFEGELQNLDIHPKLLEIYLRHPRMLMIGNVKKKCLSMVSSISWHPLDQQYPKNSCGILVIPLLLPQIPRSANMWENVKLNAIPNLKKFSYLAHLCFREGLQWNGIFHEVSCSSLFMTP